MPNSVPWCCTAWFRFWWETTFRFTLVNTTTFLCSCRRAKAFAANAGKVFFISLFCTRVLVVLTFRCMLVSPTTSACSCRRAQARASLFPASVSMTFFVPLCWWYRVKRWASGPRKGEGKTFYVGWPLLFLQLVKLRSSHKLNISDTRWYRSMWLLGF